MLLAVTNTYLGLQSGWISMMSLQAALVGFGVFKVLPSRFVKRPLSVKENVSPDLKWISPQADEMCVDRAPDDGRRDGDDASGRRSSRVSPFSDPRISLF